METGRFRRGRGYSASAAAPPPQCDTTKDTWGRATATSGATAAPVLTLKPSGSVVGNARRRSGGMLQSTWAHPASSRPRTIAVACVVDCAAEVGHR